MTDRYNALTVVLECDTRENDAQAIIEAIRMLRGVQYVQPHVANLEQAIATSRVRTELMKKLWEILK